MYPSTVLDWPSLFLYEAEGVKDDREVLSARRCFEEPLGLKSLPLPTPRTRPCPPNSLWDTETPGKKDAVPGEGKGAHVTLARD